MTRRYPIELASGIALYAALLVASNAALRSGAVPPQLAAVVALVPMIGGIAVAWAVVRQLGRLDELQRRVQLDALSLAFVGTALLTFSYGFLEGLGWPRLSMFDVWPLMATLWVAAMAVVAARRYQ